MKAYHIGTDTGEHCGSEEDDIIYAKNREEAEAYAWDIARERVDSEVDYDDEDSMYEDAHGYVKSEINSLEELEEVSNHIGGCPTVVSLLESMIRSGCEAPWILEALTSETKKAKAHKRDTLQRKYAAAIKEAARQAQLAEDLIMEMERL